MKKSLLYYWRTHLAVVAGSAVATAVLTGALLVGDSVRGSLRDLTLERLGGIDVALLGEQPFRQRLVSELASELGEGARLAPVLLLRGSAVHGESRARASNVTILGVDERLPALYDDPPDLDVGRRPGLLFAGVTLNQTLADELGAATGDELLLSFELPSEVPREMLVGRQEAVETVGTLRLSVAAVVPDRGLGGLKLVPEQSATLNAFVALPDLQRALFGRDPEPRINLVLAGFPAAEEIPGSPELLAALRRVLTVADLGLLIDAGAAPLVVESRQFVLDPPAASAVLEAAAELGATPQPVLTYLATAIRSGDREIPYSTISAVDPPATPALGQFSLVDGGAATTLSEEEVLLNRWAAEDLGVRPGDEIEIDYYVLGARDELSTETVRLRLAGVVTTDGLAGDPRLTPEFPGLEEADDISAWDPPFPVDLDRIRPADEAYWDAYRSLPKAFAAVSLGRRLWRSRFGELTSIRLAPPSGSDTAALAAGLRRELPRLLEPEAAGLGFRQLKREGLEAARGATDFAGLFLGLSIFLIGSAVLLVGLLFRLGLERRAKEIGLLRAVGYRARSVGRSLLSEGALLVAVGALAGLGGAILYAWLMLVGLRTWWLPAVGTPVLFLHVAPASPVIGWAASLLVVLGTISWTLRRLGKIPPPRLLAGSSSLESGRSGGRRAGLAAIVFTLLAAALLATAFVTGETSSPGFAFGIGACLLIAGVAAFAHLCGGSRRGRANALAGTALVSMGARNTGRNRSRSILSVALVASACFLIVAVEAFRGGGEVDVADPASGSGGYTLVAETDVPIVADLNRAVDLRQLGFREDDLPALDGVRLMPFRLLPGDDVSCLNLFRPRRPRLVGAVPEMRRRGGFTFQQLVEPVDEPWSLLERPLEPGVVPAFGDFNSVLWILHSGLGQEIEIENERGETIRLRFVALLAKGIFQSEVVISEESFVEHFPSRTGYSWFLGDPPLDRLEAVAGLLEARLERFGFDATPASQRLAAFKAVEDTYIATFQTLGGLGLLLGTVGLGIVLLRNVLERRGELAVMRAFGYRTTTLARMVVAENGVLLLAGISIGTVAGLAAAAPHLTAGGDPLPWISLLLTLAVVFAVGTLSSVLAVAGTLRTPLLPALKAE